MMDVRKMASMGQKAMRENQSKAEKVFWPLKAGRPRQSKPNPIEAIHLGRAAANGLTESMRGEGLRVADAGCFLACATAKDKVVLAAFARENQDVSDLEIARNMLHAKLEAVGVAFCVLDREKGNMLMHVRPFERTDQSELLMEAALSELERIFQKGAGLKSN